MLRQITIIFLTLSAMVLAQLDAAAQPTRLSAQQVDSLTHIVSQMPDDTTKAHTLAMICSNHPNADSTLKYTQELYSLSFKTGSRWLALAYRYLGWYCYVTGDFESAIDYMFKSLKINDSLGLRNEMALNYNSLGENLMNLGDYNTANEYFYKALELLIAINDRLTISYTYRDIAIIHYNFQLYSEAEKFLNEALRIDRNNNNVQQTALDYYYLAQNQLGIYDVSGDTAAIYKARDLSNQAYKIFKDEQSDFHTLLTGLCCMLAYTNLADVSEPPLKQQYLDSSMVFYKEAVELAEKNALLEGFNFTFELCRVNYLFVNKQYKECNKILSSLEAKALDDLKNYETYLLDIYKNFVELFKKTGNYKKAYEYQEKLVNVERSLLDYEFAANSVKLNAKDEFERAMRQRHIEETKLAMSIEEQKKRTKNISIAAAIALFLLLCLALDIYRLSRQRQNTNIQLFRQRENYKLQRDMLADANYQATSGIMYGKEIQTAILPSDELMESLFGDHLIIWKPMNLVSGDFYWAAQFGRLKFLAVADCTGHGVPGAFMSMLGITTLNDIVSTSDLENITASAILDNMNSKIRNSLRKSEQFSSKFDGMDIALCIIDAENNKLQFAGAFRQLIIMRGGAMFDYSPDKMAVGFSQTDGQKFTNNIIDLQTGDVIYLYTNGISNQFSNLDRGTRFSDDRLNKLLRAYSSKPFAEQRVIIEEALERWTTSNMDQVCPQTDDQVLIGIRI